MSRLTETLPKAKTLDKTIVIPAVKNPPEAKKERHMIENRKQNEPVKKPKVPVALLVLLITLPVVLGLFFMVYTLLLSEDEPSGPNISYADGVSSYLPSSNPSEEDDVSDLPSESIADGISVDNFVGKYYEDIENNAVYQTLYQISVVYEYDDTVEKGYIIEQSIAENTIVPKGEKIEFLVSKGSQYFVLPSITDGRGRRKTAEDYAAELKAAGIPSKVELRETDEYTPGKVIELSEPVGGKIDLKNPKKVTIYAAKEKVVSEGDIFGTSSEESKPDSQPDVQTETGDLEE